MYKFFNPKFLNPIEFNRIQLNKKKIFFIQLDSMGLKFHPFNPFLIILSLGINK